MNRIDFRERSLLEHLCSARTLRAYRSPVVYASALLCALLLVESSRLAVILKFGNELQGRRQGLALQAQVAENRTRALSERRRLLITALRLRRTNARLAIRIAQIGDALASSLALTTLRNLDDGSAVHHMEIEGRTTSITDLVQTLRRLPVNGRFEIQRQDAHDGILSFQFGFDSNSESRW